MCPSWVSTKNPHLGHSLDVFLGSTEAVRATPDILLCILFQSVLWFLFLLAFFLVTRSSLSRSSKTWIEFGNSLLKPAESLFLKSFSLFLSLALYFSYNSLIPFLCAMDFYLS